MVAGFCVLLSKEKKKLMIKILKYELPIEGNEVVIEAAIVKWLDVQVQNGIQWCGHLLI